MNSEELNTALYEKMAAEQNAYRDWLKGQSPEEIIKLRICQIYVYL